MKYPNCQFENRDVTELRGDFNQPLRQETVYPRITPASPPGRKSNDGFCQSLTEQTPTPQKLKPKKPSIIEPSSLINGRYRVKKFRGEVGRKKICLAHNVLLDRDIAVTLIKTGKSDDCSQKVY